MLMTISIGIIAPSKVHAIDISVGPTTWYTKWGREMPDGYKVNLDPAFLYGPALSVKFNDDFNLTFIYLYGKFECITEDGETRKFKRKDSDLALNYSLNDYFKVFAGVKYMGYTYSMAGSSDLNYSSFGPGLGLSVVFPIVENLFIIANISYIYLWGSMKFKLNDDSEAKNKYKEYGINSSVSIGYYIAPASTVISLGGRYQKYKTDYDDDFAAQVFNIKHKFYGITLTATYNFSI